MKLVNEVLGLLEGKNEIIKGNIKLVVKKKSSTGEWVVRWFENGKYIEDKSYFTDDKQDAIDTMKDMIKRIK
jgi:hypothetical protein